MRKVGGRGVDLLLFFSHYLLCSFTGRSKGYLLHQGPHYKNFHYIWFFFHSFCYSGAKECSTYNWDFITKGYNIMRF